MIYKNENFSPIPPKKCNLQPNFDAKKEYIKCLKFKFLKSELFGNRTIIVCLKSILVCISDSHLWYMNERVSLIPTKSLILKAHDEC